MGNSVSAAFADSTHRVPSSEAPGFHAQPSQVLHRIAQAGKFPIEHRLDTLFTADQVAHAKVPMDNSRGSDGRQMALGPAERHFKSRNGIIIAIINIAIDHDLPLGIQLGQEEHRPRVDLMNAGQDFTALAGKILTQQGKTRPAQDTPSTGAPCRGSASSTSPGR